jgi:hypothetical protein
LISAYPNLVSARSSQARGQKKSKGQSVGARTLSNAFLFLRIFLFAAAVPCLLRLKIARVAAILEPGWEPWRADPERIERITAYVETVIKRGGPLVRPGCLTLGLTRYFFLRRAGVDVSLHFGMGRISKGEGFVGHCWLLRDGEPYLERVDPRPSYVEMYRISRQDIRKGMPTGTITRGTADRPMSLRRQVRHYCVHGPKLQVLCSPAIAAYLDARFRMFRADCDGEAEVFLDFQAATDASRHKIKRPQGNGRPFYEMPKGEACYFEETDEVYLSFGDGVRALCKPGSGRASLSVVESESKNLFVASHLVLTIILVETLKRRGWYNLHAAGFSEDGKAILIPGTSGAGKSTLSLALLRAKFDYLSDDMVFLGRRPDGVVVWGLSEDVDVTDQTIHFFPELDFLLRRPKADGFPKRQVRAEEVYGTKTIAEAQPRVIVLPRISGKDLSVLRRIDNDEALFEIVPNVLLTESQACQAQLGVLAELVKQTPCYRLDTGRDFSRIPILLRELLTCDREEVRA